MSAPSALLAAHRAAPRPSVASCGSYARGSVGPPRIASPRRRGAADAAVQARLAELGFEIFARERQTPESLAAMVKTGAEKWWPIIKELQLKAD